MKNCHLIFVLLTFLAISCRETPDNFQLPNSTNYYPLSVGKSWVYQMDSITYDPQAGGTLIDTSSLFAKEEITAFTLDTNGDTVFIIDFATRNNMSDNWTTQATYQVFQTDNRLYKNENNLNVLKMVLPLQSRLGWDPVALFDEERTVQVKGEELTMFKGWQARVESINQAFSINGFDFSNTCLISLADAENAIELRRVEEVYAEEVGMVYRELHILDTQCIADCEGQDWEEKAEKGFILRQGLISYN